MNNSKNNYSSSVDSLEIWSSPHLQQSASYDSWNVGIQGSPSRLSWEDVGSFSSLHTRNKRTPHELVLDSVEEPSMLQHQQQHQQELLWQQQQESLLQQITSPNNINNDHDLIRSVDQLLLDDGADDGGDIFEFDMGDHYGSSLYGTPPPTGRHPYRRRIICKFFQNGNCKAGNKCRFSHDMSPQHQQMSYQQMTPLSQQQQQMTHPMSQQTTPIKNNSSSPSTSPQVNSRFNVSPLASLPYGVTANGIKYCKFHLNGFCRSADNCPYSHIDQQQLLALSNTSFDQAYSSPPHHSQSQHQHMMYQSPMNSIPTLSSSLPMPHTEFSPGTSPPDSDSSASSSQDANQPKVCPFFLKGDCRYGERCRNMHVKLTPNINNKKKLINEESLEKFSKIPCKYYRQGHCPFGDSCYYLHSDHIMNNNSAMYQNMPLYYEEQDQQGHYM